MSAYDFDELRMILQKLDTLDDNGKMIKFA